MRHVAPPNLALLPTQYVLEQLLGKLVRIHALGYITPRLGLANLPLDGRIYTAWQQAHLGGAGEEIRLHDAEHDGHDGDVGGGELRTEGLGSDG